MITMPKQLVLWPQHPVRYSVLQIMTLASASTCFLLVVSVLTGKVQLKTNTEIYIRRNIYWFLTNVRTCSFQRGVWIQHCEDGTIFWNLSFAKQRSNLLLFYSFSPLLSPFLSFTDKLPSPQNTMAPLCWTTELIMLRDIKANDVSSYSERHFDWNVDSQRAP